MICDGCISKNKFLLAYVNNDNNSKVSGGEATATEIVDSACRLAAFLLQEAANCKAVDCDAEAAAVPSAVTKAEACYFPEGWRNQLCRCKNCLVRHFEFLWNFV